MAVPPQPMDAVRTVTYGVPCPHGCVVPVRVIITTRAEDGRILEIVVKH